MARLYTAETYDHKPMDAAYAETRIGHEPVMEVTQVKGDSETHPFLSPNDEFANHERFWDYGNLGNPVTPKQNSMLQFEYARSALKLGLQLASKLGVNPTSSAWSAPAMSIRACIPTGNRATLASLRSQSRRRRVGKTHS